MKRPPARLTALALAMTALLAASPATTAIRQGETGQDYDKRAELVPISSTFAIPRILLSALNSPLNGVSRIESFSTETPRTEADPLTSLPAFPIENVRLRVLDESLAISLGYLSASASAGKSTFVVVEEWTKGVSIAVNLDDLPGLKEEYSQATLKFVLPNNKPTSTPSGYPENKKSERTELRALYGVSIRIVTRLDIADASATTGTVLRALSGKLDATKFSATCNVEILGLSSQEITQALPSASAFLAAQIPQEGDSTNEALAARLRYLLLLQKISRDFSAIKDTAWKVGGVPPTDGFHPMIVALDLDAVERFTHKVIVPKRGK